MIEQGKFVVIIRKFYPWTIAISLILTACGDSGGTTESTAPTNYTVSATTQNGGSVSPSSQSVNQGLTTSFTVSPDAGYNIDNVAGCNGTLSANTYTTGVINSDCTVTALFVAVNDPTISFAVTPSTGANGSINPSSAQMVNQGEAASFTVSPAAGYRIGSVAGCDGTLSANTYTTGVINSDCTVTALFVAVNDPTITFTVTPSAGANGSINPSSAQIVNQGEAASFTVTSDAGYRIAGVTGCGGSLSGNTFTTGAMAADCTLTASFELLSSGGLATPVLSLTPTAIKTFSFSWADVSDETEYRLLENPDGISGYTQVASIPADSTNHEHEVFLPGRVNASYILQACNSDGCSDSDNLFVSSTLATAVGYVKASNTGTGDSFGSSIALSADANTLAVAAYREDSNATGIGGDQNNNEMSDSGAVYVFSRKDGTWSQQAYLKASNTEEREEFGYSIALSADGNTLGVGSRAEASNATGIGGDQGNNDALGSGAVYVFTRSGSTWAQQAYIKASNAEKDQFGFAVSLSANGNTMAVGAALESSNATGIDGDQSNNESRYAGAVYVFSRSGSAWLQQAYLKASNTGEDDRFGSSVALANDGNTLAVGAPFEDSNATGINGDQSDESSGSSSGAVYVFSRSGTNWSQQAYVKASNTGAGDGFGSSIALAADSNTLAVGATREDSSATGINGDQSNENGATSGAVYVFSRSGTTWSQQAYVKASNTDIGDLFGNSVALSAEGDVLAVGASQEHGSAIGINGDQSSDGALLSGAVYVFIRSGEVWSQQAYVKATNTERQDSFGSSVALPADGNTLAVGANDEDSNAIGIGGDQTNNSATSSGAVFLY
jgi:hypothetical protein